MTTGQEPLKAEIMAELECLRDEVHRLKQTMEATCAEIKLFRLELDAALRGQRAAMLDGLRLDTLH